MSQKIFAEGSDEISKLGIMLGQKFPTIRKIKKKYRELEIFPLNYNGLESILQIHEYKLTVCYIHVLISKCICAISTYLYVPDHFNNLNNIIHIIPSVYYFLLQK